MNEEEGLELLKKRFEKLMEGKSNKEREAFYARMIENIAKQLGPNLLGGKPTERETRLLVIALNAVISVKVLVQLVDTIEPRSESEHQSALLLATAEFAFLADMSAKELLKGLIEEKPDEKPKGRKH